MSTNTFCAKVRAMFPSMDVVFSHHDGLHEAFFPADEVRIMHEHPSFGVFEFEIEFDVNLERW